MKDSEFPKLDELKRPKVILERIMSNLGGIVLVSGERCSGITTTITALGNDLKRMSIDTIYFRTEHSDIIPGLDSISSGNTKRLEKYFLHLSPPNAIIFDYDNEPEIYNLAVIAAMEGSLAIVSIRSSSTQDALHAFTRMVNKDIYVEGLITVSVHHFTRPVIHDFFAPRDKEHLKIVSRADEILRSYNPGRQRIIDTGSTNISFQVQ